MAVNEGMDDFMDINDDDHHPNFDSSRKSLLDDNLDFLPNLLSTESGDDEFIPEIERHITKKQSQRRKSLRKSQRQRKHGRKFKDYLKFMIPGVIAILFGILIYALNPYNLLNNFFLSLREGTLLYNLWREIPIKVFVNIFVFNVTNGERFANGLDKKLNLTEVGPYVYSDFITHNEVKFFDNNTLSFTGKHNLTFERAMSIGDPTIDKVIVPNVALLGIVSKVFNAPMTVKLGLSSVVSYTNAPVILNISVHDFLWGYEEPLVTFGRKLLPSWLNFDKVGILDRMLDEGNNRISISTGKEDRFKILQINGSPGLKDWGYKDNMSRGPCDVVNGTYDGILFSPNPPDRMFIYRRMLCRPIPVNTISKDGTISEIGVRVKEYSLSDNAFDNDNPENVCYCENKEGCFPSGVTDLSPCYYGIPVGMSVPHFYGSNSSIYSKLEGINPVKEKHVTYVQIQPDIGIPLYGRIPVQLNIVTRASKFIKKVKPFDNMVIPLFWLEVNIKGLPNTLSVLVWLLLEVVPPAQVTIIVVGIVGGLLLVFAANLRYACSSDAWKREFSTRKRASIIGYKIKQETRRLSTRSQAFIPLATMEASRARS